MNDPLDEDDPRIQNLHTYFVTAKVTSLCATHEQARARECGNTVEFPPDGYKVGHGKTISVVRGKYPEDVEFLPAIRYMVGGLMPAYVPQADVAPTPDLSHRDRALEKLSSRFIYSQSARDITHHELVELLRDPGTEGLIHLSQVNTQTMTLNWRDLERRPYVGFDLKPGRSDRTVLVDFAIDMEEFQFPAFMSELYWPELPNHYMCNEDYCDEIDLIFRKKKGYSAELLHVIDRFGTHTLR